MSAIAGIYLQAYLAPLAPWLDAPNVTDILINQPGEVWIEWTDRPVERIDAPELTALTLGRLAQQVAGLSHQAISRQHPLLSATLPGGARIQVVGPPATRGDLVLAIRKSVVSDLTVDDYANDGAFDEVRGQTDDAQPEDIALEALLSAGETAAFLRTAVQARKTIVVSGGTGSGKTTLLNALLKEAPATDRLIAIEDVPELHLPHPNAVGLIAARGDQGEARVTAEDLLQACLRLRPDRILLGEIRGREAFAFLRAVNTGHPGSITTVHADSPRGALDQIALMSLQAGLNLAWPEVRTYVSQVVDVIVQLGRRDGRRRVSRIVFNRR